MWEKCYQHGTSLKGKKDKRKDSSKSNQAFKSTDVHLLWMKAQISRNTLVSADAPLQAASEIKSLFLGYSEAQISLSFHGSLQQSHGQMHESAFCSVPTTMPVDDFIVQRDKKKRHCCA